MNLFEQLEREREYWVHWNWLRRYHKDMLKAVDKTREDGKERGFLIIQHVGTEVARTRMQIGTSTRVVLKMKELPIETGDMLISFHTHTCSGHDYPSTIDKRTAIALGEEYTVIGYIESPHPSEQPHIKVWRIYKKMDGKSVGARYRFKF